MIKRIIKRILLRRQKKWSDITIQENRAAGCHVLVMEVIVGDDDGGWWQPAASDNIKFIILLSF